MPTKDLHKEPFDEATLTKLEIFEKYTQLWLPTFVMLGSSTICIFDFFAGTGYDKDSCPGSPIRILQVIKQFLPNITQKNVTIKLYLNEYSSKKFNELNIAINDYLLNHKGVAHAITIRTFNEDFEILFNRLLPEIEKYPSLVFLDQNGVKFTSKKNLLTLEKTKQTDFLFFISSSYIRRFGQQKEFNTYLEQLELDVEELKKNPYKYIHQDVVNAIKKVLPKNTDLKLYPFTIKKGTNIYGIVFGAKHPVAIQKFLEVAWLNNPINGTANFDIDNEIPKTDTSGQLSFFKPEKKITKIERFYYLLEEKIRSAGIIDNKSIYLLTLEQGHPLKHANDCLITLKKSNKINYKGSSPKINYKAAYKGEDIVKIYWIAYQQSLF